MCKLNDNQKQFYKNLNDNQKRCYIKLNDVQKQCYQKAMVAIDNAFVSLCSDIGPLSSFKQKIDVLYILQEAKDKINELIEKKL